MGPSSGVIRRWLACLALGVAWVSGAGSGASVAAAQDVTLKLHHFLPPQSPAQAAFLDPWARRIEEQSGGRIKIQIYPAMQLGGKPPQLYDQVRDGVVDLVWTLPGYSPGRFPLTEVFELPFVAGTAEATTQAISEFAELYLDDYFKGVHPILLHTHAPGKIHVRGAPIERIEDMVGRKLRTPSRQTTEMLNALGAIPIGMPAPQVPQAISRGVVDGAVFPFEVTLPLRIYEMTDASTVIFDGRGLSVSLFLFAMNQASYDRLPDDLKAVIDANSGLAIAADIGRLWDDLEAPGEEAARAHGNRIVNLPPAEVARWREATMPVRARWVEEANDLGFDGAMLLSEAERLVAKYSGE